MPNARSRWNFPPVGRARFLYIMLKGNVQDKLSSISFKLLEVVERAEEITDNCGLCDTVVWEWRYSSFGMPGAIKTASFVNQSALK